MQVYKAIKYIRLSYTDDKTVESDSVANQRRLIDDYIARHPEIEVVAEKIDDGYSGVLFDRPAFQEMMRMIEQGEAKLTDVLENRSERNRWINHFMKFSTMEDIDRRAVMQLIRSIRVMGKDELHIEFNYQDEYQKAISLAEQIATKNEERMVG